MKNDCPECFRPFEDRHWDYVLLNNLGGPMRWADAGTLKPAFRLKVMPVCPKCARKMRKNRLMVFRARGLPCSEDFWLASFMWLAASLVAAAVCVAIMWWMK